MWPLTVERVANETLAHRDEARNADDGFFEHTVTHACKPSQHQVVERYLFYASCNLECKLGNLLIQFFLTKKWNIFFLTVDNR